MLSLELAKISLKMLHAAMLRYLGKTTGGSNDPTLVILGLNHLIIQSSTFLVCGTVPKFVRVKICSLLFFMLTFID